MVDPAEQDGIDASYNNQDSRVTSAYADPLLVGMPMALVLSNQPQNTSRSIRGGEAGMASSFDVPLVAVLHSVQIRRPG
jgi:hypothetical protein